MPQKLQIRFVMRHLNLVDKLRVPLPIQAHPFEVGLEFKNIDIAPIKGITVDNIRIKSSTDQNISHDLNKSLYIASLNPDESVTHWVDKLGTYMFGLADVSLNVRLDDTTKSLQTYQYDIFTKKTDPCSGLNKWLDFVYVRSVSETEQGDSNILMIVFATLTILLTAQTLYLTYLQVQPILNEQKRNDYDAKRHCIQSPDDQVPRADGGYIPCGDILKVNNITVATTSTP